MDFCHFTQPFFIGNIRCTCSSDEIMNGVHDQKKVGNPWYRPTSLWIGVLWERAKDVYVLEWMNHTKHFWKEVRKNMTSGTSMSRCWACMGQVGSVNKTTGTKNAPKSLLSIFYLQNTKFCHISNCKRILLWRKHFLTYLHSCTKPKSKTDVQYASSLVLQIIPQMAAIKWQNETEKYNC